jgi:hypothetical protein
MMVYIYFTTIPLIIKSFFTFLEILEDEEELDAEGYPARQKVNKVSLLSSLEPSELEKGFVNAEDKKIIAEDKPERFQVFLLRESHNFKIFIRHEKFPFPKATTKILSWRLLGLRNMRLGLRRLLNRF